MAARREVVLASASESRFRLLQAAGVDPLVKPSAVDEDRIEAELKRNSAEFVVAELAGVLAAAKGVAVAAQLGAAPDGPVLIACDSVLEWGGEALGKPKQPEVAIARLAQMQGTTGTLHTGHYLADLATGNSIELTVSTDVQFASMSAEEIDAYVATGEPLEVAGSFTLDGLSSPFVSSVVGDPSNVIGLSLPGVRSGFAQIGVPWLDLVAYG